MPEEAAPKLRVIEQREGTAEDLMGEYLETLSGKSASTVEAYERILGRLTVRFRSVATRGPSSSGASAVAIEREPPRPRHRPVP